MYKRGYWKAYWVWKNIWHLIGSNVQKTFDNKNIDHLTAEELRTKDGIVIKVIDKVDNRQKVA